ncbi:MAG: chromate transporter [Clostridiales bacterium]|nr:chromate transporter [Clostridiales bacterium]
MKYIELIVSFLQIGLFSFGGGNASMQLVRQQVVDLRGWLTMGEFADLIAISEMTPGPIVLNSAAFVGSKVAGVWGAVVATAAMVMPSCLIVLALAMFYRRFCDRPAFGDAMRGLRPALAALVTSAGVSIAALALVQEGGMAPDWIGIAMFALSLFALRKWKPNPVFVILGVGGAGTLLYLLAGA